jgi:hypothetical protein
LLISEKHSTIRFKKPNRITPPLFDLIQSEVGVLEQGFDRIVRMKQVDPDTLFSD